MMFLAFASFLAPLEWSLERIWYAEALRKKLLPVSLKEKVEFRLKFKSLSQDEFSYEMIRSSYPYWSRNGVKVGIRGAEHLQDQQLAYQVYLSTEKSLQAFLEQKRSILNTFMLLYNAKLFDEAYMLLKHTLSDVELRIRHDGAILYDALATDIVTSFVMGFHLDLIKRKKSEKPFIWKTYYENHAFFRRDTCQAVFEREIFEQ